MPRGTGTSVGKRSERLFMIFPAPRLKGADGPQREVFQQENVANVLFPEADRFQDRDVTRLLVNHGREEQIKRYSSFCSRVLPSCNRLSARVARRSPARKLRAASPWAALMILLPTVCHDMSSHRLPRLLRDSRLELHRSARLRTMVASDVPRIGYSLGKTLRLEEYGMLPPELFVPFSRGLRTYSGQITRQLLFTHDRIAPRTYRSAGRRVAALSILQGNRFTLNSVASLFAANLELRTRVFGRTLFSTHAVLELAPRSPSFEKNRPDYSRK